MSMSIAATIQGTVLKEAALVRVLVHFRSFRTLPFIDTPSTVRSSILLQNTYLL